MPEEAEDRPATEKAADEEAAEAGEMAPSALSAPSAPASAPRRERRRAPEPLEPLATPPGASATEPGAPLTPKQLGSVIESLLFVAGRPLEYSELRKLTGVDEARIKVAVGDLARTLEREGRGVRAQRMETAAQMVSAPEHARFIAALLGLPTQARLTTAALETLSVIAYRQPITRAQIEGIRGVNSDRALASLIQHGLAQEVGRAVTVGRPVLFGTTPEFLQQFGLASLEALPHAELPQAQAAEALRARAAQSIRDAVSAGDAAEEGRDGGGDSVAGD